MLKNKLSPHSRTRKLLIVDIDGTLLDPAAGNPGLATLLELLEHRAGRFVFGVSSGRTHKSILDILNTHAVPLPDILVSGVGSQIFYGASRQSRDAEYASLLDQDWDRAVVLSRTCALPFLRLQPSEEQNDHKVSFQLTALHEYRSTAVERALGQKGSEGVKLVWSHGRYLDIVPQHAAKGGALEYLARRWQFDLEQSVAAGDSGNDEDLLLKARKSIIVGGHAKELAPLRRHSHIYFARAQAAAGILEGLKAHGFEA